MEHETKWNLIFKFQMEQFQRILWKAKWNNKDCATGKYYCGRVFSEPARAKESPLDKGGEDRKMGFAAPSPTAAGYSSDFRCLFVFLYSLCASRGLFVCGWTCKQAGFCCKWKGRGLVRKQCPGFRSGNPSYWYSKIWQRGVSKQRDMACCLQSAILYCGGVGRGCRCMSRRGFGTSGRFFGNFLAEVGWEGVLCVWIGTSGQLERGRGRTWAASAFCHAGCYTQIF